MRNQRKGELGFARDKNPKTLTFSVENCNRRSQPLKQNDLHVIPKSMPRCPGSSFNVHSTPKTTPAAAKRPLCCNQRGVRREFGDGEPPERGPDWGIGIEWRIVIVSLPTRTSFTSRRRIFWRSATSRVSARARNLTRNSPSVSASRRYWDCSANDTPGEERWNSLEPSVRQHRADARTVAASGERD